MILLDEKMPESCEVCILSHYYPDTEKVWCNATGAILAENYDPLVDLEKIAKPKTCPLKEQNPPAEWIEGEYHILKCSRCGYTTTALSRYCPGCGAEMWWKGLGEQIAKIIGKTDEMMNKHIEAEAKR